VYLGHTIQSDLTDEEDMKKSRSHIVVLLFVHNRNLFYFSVCVRNSEHVKDSLNVQIM
jgi:hypothetical protein